MSRLTQTGHPQPVERGTHDRLGGGTAQPLPVSRDRFQMGTPGPMNIWAHNVFAFTRSGFGWDQSVQFSTLRGLIDRLDELGLRGRVQDLAIVAHGDQGGVVQISTATPLTYQNVDTYPPLRSLLITLGTYLMPTSRVIFVSCIAGQGANGSHLLLALSRLWPEVTVIGFTTFAMASFAGGVPNAPGNIFDTEQTVHLAAQMALQENIAGRRPLNRVSITAPTAKWAQSGRIVRTPTLDRTP